MTTTVRVSQRTREAISRLAKERGQTAAELLDDVIRRELENELLSGMNESFAALRRDDVAWAGEQSERAAWDAALLDRLPER